MRVCACFSGVYMRVCVFRRDRSACVCFFCVCVYACFSSFMCLCVYMRVFEGGSMYVCVFYMCMCACFVGIVVYVYVRVFSYSARKALICACMDFTYVGEYAAFMLNGI